MNIFRSLSADPRFHPGAAHGPGAGIDDQSYRSDRIVDRAIERPGLIVQRRMVESLREKHSSGQIVRIVIGILPSPIGPASRWRNAGKLDVDRLGMPVDTKPRRRSLSIG